MTGRPRRSEPKSYTQFLKPLDFLQSSSDSDSDASTGPPGANTGSTNDNSGAGRAKGKGKARRPPSDDDETSGSEYGLDHQSEVEAPQSSSDDDAVSLVETQDDSEAGTEPTRSPSPSSETSGPMGRLMREPTSRGGRSTKTRSLPVVSTTAGPSQTKPFKARVQPPWNSPHTHIDIQFSTLGPHFEPPLRRLADDGSTIATGTVESGTAMDDGARSQFHDTWTVVPFGPEKDLLQDLGWWKGKWEAEGTAAKWGGWYPEIRAPQAEQVGAESIAPFLPQLAFPSQPSSIWTTEGPVVHDVEEDPEAAAEEIPVDNEDDAERQGIKLRIGVASKTSEPELVRLARFESRRLDTFLSTKPGHILNAGGPVLGLAWCPRADPPPLREYLAVSAFAAQTTLSRASTAAPSLIQIWSLDTSKGADLCALTEDDVRGPAMSFVLGLCIDVGDAWQLQWCPKGGDVARSSDIITDSIDTLGILAGAFTDGSISLFIVPDPVATRELHATAEGDPLYLRASPALRLTLPDTSCSALAWGSHETIAAACNNGKVAVWDVGSALRTGAGTALPIQYFSVHSATIRSIAFIRVPPPNLEDEDNPGVDTDQEPTALVTTGYDGSVFLVDLRDPGSPYHLTHERGVGTAVAYSPYAGVALANDADGRVRSAVLKPRDVAMRRTVVKHVGAIWSIATSDHHPFVASTSADGTCILGNAVRAMKRKPHKGHYGQKLFRLDFSRKTGEYRMHDNIQPEQRAMLDGPSKAGAKATKKCDLVDSQTANAWPPEVGVSRADWHPNIDRSCLLATSMHCGLVRVDWIEKSE